MRYKIPKPRSLHKLSFPRLSGGLNLWELDSRMELDQSPDMENLSWSGGGLRSRDGQSYVYTNQPGTGRTAYEKLFHDNIFMHIGDGIWYCDPRNRGTAPVRLARLSLMYDNYQPSRGCFFLFGDCLYYKAAGVYVRISHTDDGFSCEKTPAYAPLIMLGCSPDSGAGSINQPENRYSAAKRLRYNADGVSLTYKLPLTDIDAIVSVNADGVTLTENEGYTFDLHAGEVYFVTAPQNEAEICYEKANAEFMQSVMSCRCAEVYGGTGSLCVVLGGSDTKNAYFWSSVSYESAGYEAGYFPAEHFNYAGDGGETITGFGRQQDALIIFKEHSVGRARMSLTDIDGREFIELPYTAINSSLGCDLPHTILLVENNLVFCNSRRGVYMLSDSSAAYETNIALLSRNVNGSEDTPDARGLLYDLQHPNGTVPVAFDDDRRYWIVVAGHAYLWDYTLSSAARPSWFYYTGIAGTAFIRDAESSYHIDSSGRLTVFDRSYSDYGAGIPKRYRFAAQGFGGYDRLKDVLYAVFSIRGDTPNVTKLYYYDDTLSGERAADIESGSPWRLVPRRLSYRDLTVNAGSISAKRVFGCRATELFSMRLCNDTAGEDLCIVSAELYFRYSRLKK